MSHEGALDYRKHVRTYLFVFSALAVLTVVTVLVSTLHLTPVVAVSVALTIATIKASLVGCYFMHLISEKKLIWTILILTIVIFSLMVVIMWLADHGVLTSNKISR